MKQLRLLWLACFFFLLSGFAFADGVDPTMVVNDPCDGATGSVAPGGTFSFTAMSQATDPQTGAVTRAGGTFCFNVVSNPGNVEQQITSIDFETLGNFTVSCFSEVFGCQVTQLGGVTDIYLSGNKCVPPPGVEFGGCNGFIPVGGEINISLNDIGMSTGGWVLNGAPSTFAAFTDIAKPTDPLIATPEPSSMLLLASGAGALWSKRKYLLRARKN